MSDVKQECLRLFNSGMKPQEIYDTYYSTVREATFSTFDRMLRKWKAETKPVQKDKRAFDLIETLKKGIQMSELSDRLNVSPKACEALIDDIRGQGYNVQQIGEEIKISNIIVPADNRIANQWNGEKVIRFGLMGDTQINSKYTQITHLHDFYDKCKAEGIDTVYHTGDIDDGEKMRPGHEYELYNQGADDHIAEIVKVYPNNGVKTYFITGNHDAAYVKLCGLDIGYKIAEKRPDMIYLGYMSSTINLTDNCTMELRHPIDGTAYAISYKIQKMIEAMSGGEKPNILAIGHYHKSCFMPYRNVHSIQTGCFQAQSNWMKGKSIAAVMGGWIVEIHVDEEGTITRIKPEFIEYYKAIKDDWRNFR